jgi:hypothetical protein
MLKAIAMTNRGLLSALTGNASDAVHALSSGIIGDPIDGSELH